MDVSPTVRITQHHSVPGANDTKTGKDQNNLMTMSNVCSCRFGSDNQM